MTSASTTFMWTMIGLSIVGCGARTGFGSVVDDSAPTGTTSAPIDSCPSAILAGAPKAMAGNCSTRDGRTRAAAPKAPHIRWTTQIPSLGAATQSLEVTGLVTDGAGNTFLSASSPNGYGYTPAFRKFDSKGTVSWVSNFAQGNDDDGPGPTPFLTTNDSILLFGGPPLVVSSIDPKSGAPSQVGAFGFQHRNAQDPAIGRDGSLYFVHEVSGNPQNLAVSRANADGTIAWTSEELPAGQTVSEVALGNEDTVFVAVSSVPTAEQRTKVYAFAAATGNSLWTQTLVGALLSDVRVRSDGLLVVSHFEQNATVSMLGPTGEVVYDVSVPGHNYEFQALAVAADGGVLVYSPDDNYTLAATGPDGTLKWMKQFISIADATVTSDGIVIAATSSPSAIVALDFSNGNVVWTIPAPSPNSCLLGATLTSDSTVVGVQCDGTVFGASD